MAESADIHPDLSPQRRRALGARLQRLRHQLGVSQRGLGRRIGIRNQRISRIEHGRVAPRLGEALALAAGLGVGLEELVNGTPPPAPASPLSAAVRDLQEVLPLEEQLVLARLARAALRGIRAATPAAEGA